MLLGKAVSRATGTYFILYPCLFLFQVPKQFEFNVVTEIMVNTAPKKVFLGEVKELLDIQEKLNKSEITEK